ncbi:MAG TPA: hypothetical protein VK760_04230, partial [Candidatus Acidoferrales bacterium]|nr:hypothetical protein [Candidatus Acidoferrales bacterium]
MKLAFLAASCAIIFTVVGCAGTSTASNVGLIPGSKHAVASVGDATKDLLYFSVTGIGKQGKLSRVLAFPASGSGSVKPTSTLPQYDVEGTTVINGGLFLGERGPRDGVFYGGGVFDSNGSRLASVNSDEFVVNDAKGDLYVVQGQAGDPGQGCAYQGDVTVQEYAFGRYQAPPIRSVDLG